MPASTLVVLDMNPNFAELLMCFLSFFPCLVFNIQRELAPSPTAHISPVVDAAVKRAMVLQHVANLALLRPIVHARHYNIWSQLLPLINEKRVKKRPKHVCLGSKSLL